MIYHPCQYIRPAATSKSRSTYPDRIAPTLTPDGTYIVHVYSTLYNYDCTLADYLGTSYPTIRREIAACPPHANQLLLLIDSPGGSVHQCHDTATLIASLTIPTAAYIIGEACSAAYFLASACDQIIASPSAIIGSIGVCITIPNEPNGTITITNSAATHKRPTTPLSDDHIAYYTDLCDQLAEPFHSFVTSHRTISPDALSGKVYSAHSALSLGLIDDIQTIPHTLDHLHKQPAP